MNISSVSSTPVVQAPPPAERREVQPDRTEQSSRTAPLPPPAPLPPGQGTRIDQLA